MKLNGAVFNTVHDHFLTLIPVKLVHLVFSHILKPKVSEVATQKKVYVKSLRAENENSRTETRQEIPNPKNRKFFFSNFKTKFQKRKNRKPIDTKTEKLNIFSAKKRCWLIRLPVHIGGRWEWKCFDYSLCWLLLFCWVCLQNHRTNLRTR